MPQLHDLHGSRPASNKTGAVYGQCTVIVRLVYGHCTVSVRSLYGQCTVIVRSVYGHYTVMNHICRSCMIYTGHALHPTRQVRRMIWLTYMKKKITSVSFIDKIGYMEGLGPHKIPVNLS